VMHSWGSCFGHVPKHVAA